MENNKIYEEKWKHFSLNLFRFNIIFYIYTKLHNNNKKKKNGKSELMSFSANQVNRHRFEKREIFTRKFNFLQFHLILFYHFV